MKGYYFAQAAVLALTAALPARAANDYPSTVIAQGPVGYWRLGELTLPQQQTTNAANLGSLGAAANGAYQGVPAFLLGAAGALASSDTAANFDGTSQSVAVPYNASLNPATFSFEAWLKAEVSGSQCPLSCGEFASPRSGWLIYQSGANGYNLRMYNQNALVPSLNIVGTTTNVLGVYTHLAVTFDGTTASLYLNGALATNGIPTSYVPGTDGKFTIGIRADAGFPWAGSADEVAFYTSVLSSSDVAAHAAAARTNAAGYATQILADNPLLYLRLDESSGCPPAANLGTLGATAGGEWVTNAAPGISGPRPPTFPGFDAGNDAAGFDGVGGGYVALPPLNLDTNTVTITGWVYPSNSTQADSAGLVFTRSSLTVAGLQISKNGGTELDYTWNNDPNTYNTASGVNLTASDWNYVALVIRPQQAEIYVIDSTNSSAIGSFTNVMNHVAQNFEDLTLIGADLGFTPVRFFDGSIDEVAIFNRALGEGDLYTQYGAAVGGLTPIVFTDPQAPSNQLFLGDTLTLTVDAGGTPPLSFQWYQGTTKLAGANASTYTKTNIGLSDAGSYSVAITGPNGTATSAQAAITVNQLAMPAISRGLASRTIYPGGSLDLAVTASGGQLVFYWTKNGAPLTTTTTPAYVVSSVTTNDAGTYALTISNRLGIASSGPVTITVPSPAAGSYEALILKDAPEAWWRLDDPVGSTNLFDGMGRHDGAWVTLSGNPPALGAPGVLANDPDTAATFDGTSESFGQIPYSTALNTETFTVECWVNTTYLTNIDATTPVPCSSQYSTNGWFFWGPDNGGWVGGVGDGGIEYTVPTTVSASKIVPGQWTHLAMAYSSLDGLRLYINGQWDNQAYVDFARNTGGPFLIGALGVAGATDPTTQPDNLFNGTVDEVAFYTHELFQTNLQAHYAARYGANTKPVFLTQPFSQTVGEGASVTLHAQVQGTLPISLQWLRNGVAIANATNSSLSLTNLAVSDSSAFQLMAVNPPGTNLSSVANLIVLPTPTFANATNSLVLHMKFDGDLTDATGLGHVATAYGSPPFVTGEVGTQAISMDTDTNQNIYNFVGLDAATDLIFGATDSFSIVFWIKYGGLPNDLPMIGNAVNSTYNEGWVFTDDTGKIEWTLTDVNGFQVFADPVPGSPTTDDTNWHHIGFSLDRTAATATTYVDGVLVDQRSVAGLDSLDSGSNITLGQAPEAQSPTSTPYTVDGAYTMDDLGIWRRPLTALDICAIYNSGRAGTSFDTPGNGTVSVALVKVGASLELLWQAGVLEQAPFVLGPWTPVSNAAAPSYVVTPSPGNLFYRVHVATGPAD